MRKNGEKRNFRKEILNYLLLNPSGLTITDIANGIDTSRITVSKYISGLEGEKKIKVKKIGAYKLYHNVKRGLIPKSIMLSYYTGLLVGLKEEIKDIAVYKKFGKRIADFMEFPYGSSYPDEVMPTKKGDIKSFLKYFGKTFTFVDFIYEERPKVETIIVNEKGIFILNDIELFDRSEDYDVHFHIASGVIEGLISKSLERDVVCNVEDIDIKNKKVKMVVEFI